MAKAAGRKRIYSAFSRALSKKGFSFDGDVALSLDGKIRIEFAGSEWHLFIDNKHILTHEMITGSMKKLEYTISIHGKKSSVKKVSGSKQKREGQDNLLPKMDRIEIRKFNKQKGLAITADQKIFKQKESNKAYKEQLGNFLSQMEKIGFSLDGKSEVLKYDIYTVFIKSDIGTWRLFSYDRLLGEGVASLQSIEVIEKIIGEIL